MSVHPVPSGATNPGSDRWVNLVSETGIRTSKFNILFACIPSYLRKPEFLMRAVSKPEKSRGRRTDVQHLSILSFGSVSHGHDISPSACSPSLRHKGGILGGRLMLALFDVVVAEAGWVGGVARKGGRQRRWRWWLGYKRRPEEKMGLVRLKWAGCDDVGGCPRGPDSAGVKLNLFRATQADSQKAINSDLVTSRPGQCCWPCAGCDTPAASLGVVPLGSYLQRSHRKNDKYISSPLRDLLSFKNGPPVLPKEKGNDL